MASRVDFGTFRDRDLEGRVREYAGNATRSCLASVRRGVPENRVREYWDWIAVALFLFTALDMSTTMYAAHLVGPGGEANPFMRWLLVQGVGVLVTANVVAVVLVAVLFYGLVETLEHTPSPYDRYFAASVEAWLGGLLAAGFLVFANNLTVIFLGRSLL